MAIFGQIPSEELGTKYTHYGWFCGLCPVYLGDIGSEAPVVAERNGIPSWWLAFVTELFGLFIIVNTFIDDDYEPMWPMKITGAIK